MTDVFNSTIWYNFLNTFLTHDFIGFSFLRKKSFWILTLIEVNAEKTNLHAEKIDQFISYESVHAIRNKNIEKRTEISYYVPLKNDFFLFSLSLSSFKINEFLVFSILYLTFDWYSKKSLGNFRYTLKQFYIFSFDLCVCTWVFVQCTSATSLRRVKRCCTLHLMDL